MVGDSHTNPSTKCVFQATEMTTEFRLVQKIAKWRHFWRKLNHWLSSVCWRNAGRFRIWTLKLSLETRHTFEQDFRVNKAIAGTPKTGARAYRGLIAPLNLDTAPFQVPLFFTPEHPKAWFGGQPTKTNKLRFFGRGEGRVPSGVVADGWSLTDFR